MLNNHNNVLNFKYIERVYLLKNDIKSNQNRIVKNCYSIFSVLNHGNLKKNGTLLLTSANKML